MSEHPTSPDLAIRTRNLFEPLLVSVNQKQLQNRGQISLGTTPDRSSCQIALTWEDWDGSNCRIEIELLAGGTMQYQSGSGVKIEIQTVEQIEGKIRDDIARGMCVYTVDRALRW